jgi:hypothetical protein
MIQALGYRPGHSTAGTRGIGRSRNDVGLTKQLYRRVPVLMQEESPP